MQNMSCAEQNKELLARCSTARLAAARYLVVCDPDLLDPILDPESISSSNSETSDCKNLGGQNQGGTN
jgi:hypothetical protein